MKKDNTKIFAIILMIILIIGISFFNKSTEESELSNIMNNEENTNATNLFYEYSDNILSWNLYNGEEASINSLESGYKYYKLKEENEENNENQLLISMGDFNFWFRNPLEYSSSIFNGRSVEKKLDIGKDLRNNWKTNNENYLTSDISNKYNIERKVTLKNSYTDEDGYTKYYDDTEYYSSYMDIYTNSNNEIVYAVPQDIRTISYVTKDEVNTDAVQGNQTQLEGRKISNINNIIDSLDEPNYAIVTNNYNATKLTYVWKIFEDYYFYYTISQEYYFQISEKVKIPLTGTSISDFEYGIVNRKYVYYINSSLAMLFDAIDNNYTVENWMSLEK